MSALAHPNDLDAIEHRNNTIRHAARTLYRDPAWIGHIKTGDWLLRIHYLEEDVVNRWLEDAAINPWRPVCELRPDQRDRLIRLMLAYAKQSTR